MLVATQLDRFHILRQQLLQDPEFTQGDACWQKDGAAVVRFKDQTASIVNASDDYQAIYQTVPVEQLGHYTVVLILS